FSLVAGSAVVHADDLAALKKSFTALLLLSLIRCRACAFPNAFCSLRNSTLLEMMEIMHMFPALKPLFAYYTIILYWHIFARGTGNMSMMSIMSIPHVFPEAVPAAFHLLVLTALDPPLGQNSVLLNIVCESV